MVHISLQGILDRIQDLPPLPQSVHKVLEITRNPESSAQDLASVLEVDQALTARILKLANSSYYGFSREISTISHAVVCLGFSTIKSLAITASTYKMLNSQMPAYDMEQGALWQHSIATAAAARFIAQRVKYKDPEEAYIASLMHDIGKLMLSQYANDLFKIILERTANGATPFNIAEREVLGFDHAEIGGKIAERWNLPPALVEAIAHHHDPFVSAANLKLTCITHLANTITEMLGIGLGNDGLMYAFQQEVLDTLDLQEKDIEVLMSELTTVISDIEL